MIQYSIQLVWNQKELEFSKNSSQPLKVNQSRRKSRRRNTNEDHGRHQYVIFLHFMSYAWSCIIYLDNVNSVRRQVKLLNQGTCQFLVEEFDPLEDSWSSSKFLFLFLSFLRPGFHIIIRSLKTIAGSLRQSASVSRLTCFHIVIINRKESLGRIYVKKVSFSSRSQFNSRSQIRGKISTIRLVSDERVITSKQ